ncbi:tyrosine-type recombinase/integrase [Frankia sp. CiP1_Cm_nod2]|uniref:tyrosine-type recombinase/integrase n=1 Tax=Frankia sp. CiP1_Cm_nod2 TaxID=2897161 RepID=UPI002024397C
MARIKDRWFNAKKGPDGERVKSARYGKGDRWQVEYVDDMGQSKYPTFARKVDAENCLNSVEADKLRGTYIDPVKGRTLVRGYVRDTWLPAQVQHAPNTAARTETILRVHILPAFGDAQLGRVRRSAIQAWITGLAETHAPGTVHQIYTKLSGIFSAAHEDDLIPRNPCRNINLPVVTKTRVTPLPVLAVEALIDAAPDYWRAAVILGAGSGQREGEVLGLTLDRVEWLHRRGRVDRQAQSPAGKGQPHLRPTKTPSSDRLIPYGDTVITALAAHVKAYPPELVEVDVYTERAKGAKPRRVAVRLLWVGERRGGVVRAGVFTAMWAKTVKRAEVALRARAVKEKAAGHDDLAGQYEATADRLAGGADFHELRHFYASLLIASGANVKVVQARLGHKSATETLDTYGHLWPDSEEDTRKAVDAVLGALPGAGTAQKRPSAGG